MQHRYDGRGRLARVVNARGHAMDHLYEPWGGLEEIRHYPSEADAIAGTNLARTLAYGYDLEGNLTLTSDDDPALDVSGSLYTISHDLLGRVDLATAHYLPGGDRVLDSAYNRFGERRELKLIQGAETLTHSWTFDALGRLDLASFPGSSPLDFTPFADDTLERITHASGATTDYSYYPQGPIETITLKAGGTTQRNHLGYTVNGVQNITQLSEQHASSDPSQSYLYGYDGADRLTSADYPAAYGLPADESFGYDPAGNREDPADPNLYAYDANNRIAASPGPLAYGFDVDFPRSRGQFYVRSFASAS